MNSVLCLSDRQTIPSSELPRKGGLKDNSRSVALNHAEIEIYKCLLEGEFCYVVTREGIPTTSLVHRVIKRLSNTGHIIASLNLEALGDAATAEDWYSAMIDTIGEQLPFDRELEEFWEGKRHLSPLQRFFSAIHEVLLAKCDHPLVFFVENLEAVRSLPFSADEFFAAIRQCHNGRIEDSTLYGLTFCLLGTAPPSGLLRDVRTTPFNIGRRVNLSSGDAVGG
jgi:hypothetical protein